jgi:hypothetical protein
MEQKTPEISNSDIKRIIKRDFSQSEFVETENILQLYKSESESGRNRVFASILKLSNGDLELLKKFVEKAKYDFRDIISLSEYPSYTEHAFGNDLSEQKKKQLIEDDWSQYKYWFDKTPVLMNMQ